MILVDSSAWIEFLRRTGSPEHLRLRTLLEADEEIATTEPIAMELIAGARTQIEERLIRGALAGCRLLTVTGTDDWESAGQIYRECRRAGITPRRLLDCLVAAVAIRRGAFVLARDRDFERIAEHTALELAR